MKILLLLIIITFIASLFLNHFLWSENGEEILKKIYLGLKKLCE